MINQVMKKEVTYDMCKDWNQYSEGKRGKKGKKKKDNECDSDAAGASGQAGLSLVCINLSTLH